MRTDHVLLIEQAAEEKVAGNPRGWAGRVDALESLAGERLSCEDREALRMEARDSWMEYISLMPGDHRSLSTPDERISRFISQPFIPAAGDLASRMREVELKLSAPQPVAVAPRVRRYGGFIRKAAVMAATLIGAMSAYAAPLQAPVMDEPLTAPVVHVNPVIHPGPVWPLQGCEDNYRVSSPIGTRTDKPENGSAVHLGNDIGTREQDSYRVQRCDAVAVLEGDVVSSAYLSGLGRRLEVQTEQGTLVYHHLRNDVPVVVGDHVFAGQRLGSTLGTNLHVEFWIDADEHVEGAVRGSQGYAVNWTCLFPDEEYRKIIDNASVDQWSGRYQREGLERFKEHCTLYKTQGLIAFASRAD